MKEKKFIFRLAAGFILILSMMSSFMLTGYAAELRDYRLPSEKSRPYYGVQTISPDDEFRAKVKPLTGNQRKKLKESFIQKYKTATKEDEKAYYQNLIRILDEFGTN